MAIIPYLMFNGDCAEAIEFYCDVLGAKLTSKALFNEVAAYTDGNDAGTNCPFDESEMDKIINAQLELPDGSVLMLGDAPNQMGYEGHRGTTFCLNFPTVEEGEAAFNRIAAGGMVTMPYSDTFWAKKFGMCLDKFGVPWLVNGEPLM